MNYTIKKRNKARTILALVAAVLVCAAVFEIAYSRNLAAAEEHLAKCWVMCKPGSRVTIRMEPRKGSAEAGFLECGDWFMTDGESVDGWISCIGAGEGGWIYCGYVVTEKPELIGRTYMCNAGKQAACRKWMGGPQVDTRPWIRNGETCQVFVMADGWAVTSRGYIKSEWLELSAE